MSPLGIIVLLLVLLLLLGVVPIWPYSTNFGHYPASLLGVILIIILILALTGRM